MPLREGGPRVPYPVIVVVGPTAIGKTAMTMRLCAEFDCEVISMDSMQVYRSMDIGTAKPSRQEQQQVRHHLIDVVDPDEQYDAARFVRDCLRAVDAIGLQGKTSLITGGTGLYLTSLINGLFDTVQVSPEIRNRLQLDLEEQGSEVLHARLMEVDPQAASRIHVNDRQRILRGLELFEATGLPWTELVARQGSPVRFEQMLQLGLSCERDVLYRRIDHRAHSMMEQGLLAEVASLQQRGYGCELASMQAIGYRHICAYLAGKTSLELTLQELQRDTRRYAKRQLTWFRKMKGISWLNREDTDGAVRLCMNFLQQQQDNTNTLQSNT